MFFIDYVDLICERCAREAYDNGETDGFHTTYDATWTEFKRDQGVLNSELWDFIHDLAEGQEPDNVYSLMISNKKAHCVSCERQLRWTK